MIAGIGCRIDDISDPHKMEREAYATKKRMAERAEQALGDLKYELRSEKRYTIMDNVHLDHGKHVVPTRHPPWNTGTPLTGQMRGVR